LGSLGIRKKIDANVLNATKTQFPTVNFHLFGSLNRETLFKYKPYSADASSWAKEAGQGSIYYWDDIDKKEYSIDIASRIKPKPAAGSKQKVIFYNDFHHKTQLNSFLKNTFDYTYKDLLNVALPRQMVNLYYLTQLQALVNASTTEKK
jgi:hypothetical protein